MNPTLISGPTVEPLTLAEAKEHLKIDHADEDNYITSLISASRKFAEDYTRLRLIEQTLMWTLDRWPGYGGSIGESHPLVVGYQKNRFIEVPRGPLISVTSITTYDDADVGTEWDAENYYVSSPQNRIYRRTGVAWPSAGRTGGGIEILYKAGFGTLANDIPKSLRQALLQMVSHLYIHREPVTEGTVLNVPFTVREQLNLFRKISL